MKKVLLIGETCKDIFKYGKCSRLNPEAPTPVFLPTKETINDGMSGNVKANLEQLLGHPVSTITHEEKIEKIRYVDEHSNYILLRVDNEPKITPLTIDTIESYPFNIEDFELVVVSDYDKGFLSDEVLAYIFSKAKVSFIDTKRPIGDWAKDVSFIKVNESESQNPLHADLLKSEDFYHKTMVTLGKDGCTIGDTHVLSTPVDVMDVVGAGDTFLAAASTKYLENKSILEAIMFANECAAYVVTQKGVAIPNRTL